MRPLSKGGNRLIQEIESASRDDSLPALKRTSLQSPESYELTRLFKTMM